MSTINRLTWKDARTTGQRRQRAIRHESRAGYRYGTDMAVMILRLCTGEPPRYLSQDVRGF